MANSKMRLMPKSMQMLSLLTLALTAASCTCSTQSVPVQALKAVAPEPLLRPCKPPVALVDQAIGAAQVAKAWGTDRVSLVECLARHGALSDFEQSKTQR